MDGDWAEQPGALLFSDNEAENQLPSSTEDIPNRQIPGRVAGASRKSSKATLTKGLAGKNSSVRKNTSERIDNNDSDEDVVMISNIPHKERDREQILPKPSRASVKRALPRSSNRSSVVASADRSSVRPPSSRQATLNFSQLRSAASTQRRQQPVCLKLFPAYIVTNSQCRAKMRYPTTMLLSPFFLTRRLREVADEGVPYLSLL